MDARTVKRAKLISISVDVEEDIPPYLSESFEGIRIGLPRLLALFSELKIKADFFVTAEVCEKFPNIVRQIVSHAHNLGCHGLRHEILARKSYAWQLKHIQSATERLKKLLNYHPILFRAPMFAADGTTVKVLDALKYRFDSSVLPNRVMKKVRLFTIFDHTGAPKQPYHPSYNAICSSGEAKLLELPLTENPFLNRTPIGCGYLNVYGLENTLSAIRRSESSYVTFLIHPWECIKLEKKYPHLPASWRRVCRDNIKMLEMLLEQLKSEFEFQTLAEIGARYEK